jgi:hypothetical protein
MGSCRAIWGVTPVSKAVADEWSARAVLTLPVLDLAGDLVRAEGLDFSLHESDPWVDLEHGRTTVKRTPVGWARKSLDRPGAPYAVEWADLDVPGVGTCRLPVGTTYFDRDDPLQRQVYELVRRDALPGVSLEFLPLESRVIADRSPLEPRPAYEFLKARVLRWSHCAEPVNPGALTVLKSLPPSAEVIAKAVRDGRIGTETLHPYLRQVYAEYRTTTRVHVEKAMPDDRDTAYEPDKPDDDLDTDNTDVSGESPPNNGVSALYAHVQALLDACEQLEEDLESTDNPELYKAGQELCEQTRALAEQIKAVADKHDSKLQSLKSGSSEPETEGTDEAGDISTDREGMLKAVRPVYRDVLKASRGRVKRYRMRDIIAGVKRARNPLAALEEVKAKDPEGYARLIEPRLRRLRMYSN